MKIWNISWLLSYTLLYHTLLRGKNWKSNKKAKQKGNTEKFIYLNQKEMPNVSNSLYYIEDWNLKLNGLFDLSQINSQNCEHSPDFNLKTYQDLLYKSIGWFLYDRDLRHERVHASVTFIFNCATWRICQGLFKYRNCITHIEPTFPFGIPWKHQKTFRFSNIIRGSQKGTLAQYRLKDFVKLSKPNLERLYKMSFVRQKHHRQWQRTVSLEDKASNLF